MDWNAKVQATLDHFGSRKRVYPVNQSLKLIDFFAQKATATEEEMQSYGTAVFVGTILGHVTTAVHGKGSVPLEGGWYRHDFPSATYTIAPGFAKAWLAAIPGR
ncbi:hypothetical protein [Methylobacterium bullatum]|uniref:Uncharacterized protein n=1 Tax=Methylobacterium bullatum TaxID=570505 RepID=A0A679K3X0_9HYPH|nr:hypothetical protein MBLL_01308 [Methylobacterium bullatum]